MTILTSSLSLGILAGAAWNAANFCCLKQLFAAWMGPSPSRTRVIGWLLAKFVFLYPSAFLLLRHPAVSPFGFGLGFTLVLLIGMGVVLLRAQRTIAHGR